MSTFQLKGVEIECLKKLAEMYEAGQTSCSAPQQLGLIGLTAANYKQVLGVLESAGVVTKPTHTSGGWYSHFVISPRVVQLTRQIADNEAKEKEGKDLVESLKTTVRKHPVYAWVVIIFLVFTAVMTALSQTTTFLKNVGVIGDKPTPPPATQPISNP